MELREEYNLLVETVKKYYREAKRKITIEEMAARLGYTRTYMSGLIGGSKELTTKHLEDFRLRFREELSGVIPEPGDKMNPERSLLVALLDEVATMKSEKEGISYAEAKNQLKKKASLILQNLDSWLPE